ncbi:hypothetical protein ACFOLJ_09925 [Rugamonas sp. CCM 8940]|uniref:hypothetical protein n=1 Tax=Rugamonas sp. CCM 8940 TaxID=2765359 RepID=UPI0018F77AC9|nr:hypothetical protein [Rugamonas sp. CCM 8940]MBJ7313321.1 hypothetical protein [Rugamonas sp. CCM 8940]
MHTLPAVTAPVLYGTAAKRRWGIGTGLAVSLALHALLILAYRFAWQPPPVDPARPAPTLTVWLRPVPPPVARLLPPPTPPATPAPKTRPARQRAERTPRRAAATEASAAKPAGAPAPPISLPSPAGEQRADLFAAEQKPKFDMEAARKSARKLANNLDDPARAGTAVAQLDKKPLYPEERDGKLARDIAGAKRANCKDGVPGGLLAPLFLLMDKKDSGCKW